MKPLKLSAKLCVALRFFREAGSATLVSLNKVQDSKILRTALSRVRLGVGEGMRG